MVGIPVRCLFGVSLLCAGGLILAACDSRPISRNDSSVVSPSGVASAPASAIPAATAREATLHEPSRRANIPPTPEQRAPLECETDGGVELLRLDCEEALPAPSACESEGLRCLYPAEPRAGCFLAADCVFGVWTPVGPFCPGPELFNPGIGVVVEPSDAAVPALSDASVPAPGDAGASEAGALDEAGEPPFTGDAPVAQSVDAGAGASLPSACPGLIPVLGSPCELDALSCGYGACADGLPARELLCSCGRWVQRASRCEPQSVSPLVDPQEAR